MVVGAENIQDIFYTFIYHNHFVLILIGQRISGYNAGLVGNAPAAHSSF